MFSKNETKRHLQFKSSTKKYCRHNCFLFIKFDRTPEKIKKHKQKQSGEI